MLLIFGRPRFSDGMQITGMKVDAITVDGVQCGFLECQAERTKTSLTLERKTRFLPVAIPLLGFTNPCWVHAWLELRGQQGLQCKVGTPMITSPVQGGDPAGQEPRSLLALFLTTLGQDTSPLDPTSSTTSLRAMTRFLNRAVIRKLRRRQGSCGGGESCRTDGGQMGTS